MTVSQPSQFTQQTQQLLDGEEETVFSDPSSAIGPVAWGRLIGSCVLALTEPEYVFGRHRTCTVHFDEPEVSNRHCKLYRTDQGTVFLEDLSTNGTRVNGKKIGKGNRIPLQHQDHVEILAGRYFFVFNDTTLNNLESTSNVGDYVILNNQMLGSGTFATVKVAIDNRTGIRYACKVIDKKQISCASPNQNAQIRREIAILKKLDHVRLCLDVR